MRICVVKYNTKTGVTQLQGVSFRIKDKCKSERTPGPSVHECSVLQLCLTLCHPMDYSLPSASVHGVLQAKNTGVGWYFLLQGILPSPGSEPKSPAFLSVQADSSLLSHQGGSTGPESVQNPSMQTLLSPRSGNNLLWLLFQPLGLLIFPLLAIPFRGRWCIFEAKHFHQPISCCLDLEPLL